MKIACQACQAKYTIADEKVVGKIVKIRCKKCGATIVINGNESEGATQVAPAPGGGQAFDYAGQTGEPWTVNVADGDQRTMTTEEIVAAYHSGVVSEETFCWKDGMSDWLPLREIGELSAALSGGAPAAGDDEATAAIPTGGGGAGFSSLFGGNGGGGNNGGAPLFGGDAPAAAAATPAARRAGGRGAGGADLFGAVATAGGEEDVMTSASAQAAAGGEAKTGERNENSVLFSLSALTDKAPAQESKTTATTEGSGLIDIRALSASMSDKDSKQGPKHVDDIMNLGGGGAFAPALAAPVLAAPPADVSELQGDGGGKNKSNVGLMIGLVLGGLLIVGGAVGAAVYFAMRTEPVATNTTGTSTTTTATAPATTETTATTTTPTQSVATNDTAPTATSTAKGPSTGTTVNTSRPTTNNNTTTTTTPVATTPPPPTGGACCPGESEMQCNMRKSAGQPCPTAAAVNTGAGGGAPFDRGAAAGALGAVNLSSCKKPDGPSGSGHVKVTFQPNGTVSTVEVDQPPFSGTAVGGCIAGKYRGVKIPPFSGSPVSVGKSFSLN